MKRNLRRSVVWIGLLALASLALGGCSSVSLNVGPTATPVVQVVTATPEPTLPPTVEPTATATAIPTATPAITGTVEADGRTAETEPPAPDSGGTATVVIDVDAPDYDPETVATCSAYQGEVYTRVFSEQEINATLSGALQASQGDFVNTRSVSLQDGVITTYAKFQGRAGQTVDRTLALAVWAQNYDLAVAVIEARAGAFSLSAERQAVLNTTLEAALESQLAQSHDYLCVNSVTIANGTMTVVYH